MAYGNPIRKAADQTRRMGRKIHGDKWDKVTKPKKRKTSKTSRVPSWQSA